MRNGQSLVEALVAIAVGALFIIGAAAAIAPSLQTNKQVSRVQVQTQLSNELLTNVRSWSTGNWTTLLSLSTSSANTYYLITSSSPFTATTGTESVTVGGVLYLRNFYLGDVYRDSNGNVTTTVSGNNYDPSTKSITVAITVSSTGSSAQPLTFSEYLTRNVNNVFAQSSWSGGAVASSPVTLAPTAYAAAVSMTVNATGSIQLGAPPGGSCQE